MLEAIGIIIGLVGMWLFLCDKRNEFAFMLMAIGLFMFGVSTAIARDLGQWKNADPEISAWYRNLMQPDNPTVSCCSFADAYYADEIRVRDGKVFAVVTDDRPDDPLGRPHIPVGTEFEVPAHKLKWDKSNPTGHNVLFVSSTGHTYCFVQGTGT